MREFLDENFLLTTPSATRLYHNYAKTMPIYDYHCHLNPQDIAQNRQYANLTQLWLAHDHYKWRLMRSYGLEESLITGDADEYEKFVGWCKVISKAIGNPLYHWAHMELRTYFNIDLPLSEVNAPMIWQLTKEQLKLPNFSARSLIERSGVVALNTTDDPLDSLEHHLAISQVKGFTVKVMPTFRPDPILYINKEGFLPWLLRLEQLEGAITHLRDLELALERRLERFVNAGCRLSDHGIDRFVYITGVTAEEVNRILQQKLAGGALTSEESERYFSYMLRFFAKAYAKLGWVMQLHMGVQRNINQRAYRQLGADSGFDAIGHAVDGVQLAAFLNDLELDGCLPKTIFYSIYPSDTALITTIMGAFQAAGSYGKMQLGSAWWFNDTYSGMQQQLRDLANLGLLSSFVGMLTDSRSFTSYVRHDYFRRILCNQLGLWLEQGEVADETLAGEIIKEICFNNSEKYFGLSVK